MKFAYFNTDMGRRIALLPEDIQGFAQVGPGALTGANAVLFMAASYSSVKTEMYVKETFKEVSDILDPDETKEN